MAASVRQLLQNVARKTNRPFQEILEYFAMERFLYRLASSKHASRFVLKGALLFRVWNAPVSRPTRDIDLFGRMDNKVTAVVPVFRDVWKINPSGSTAWLHTDSVVGQAIKEDADYTGVRVTFLATLQNSRIAMQIDVGFGDVLTPAAEAMEYPTILDLPAPRLDGYSRETVVAEKWLGSLQRNHTDIRPSQDSDLRGANGADAGVCRRRAKQTQWRAFLRKTRLTDAPTSLPDVIAVLASFLLPMAQAIADGQAFNRTWRALGPWK